MPSLSNSLVGRRVKILRTHTTLHIPGCGQFEQAIDTSSPKFRDVSLTVKHGFVLLETKGFELLVPDANIISLLLYPNETNSKAK